MSRSVLLILTWTAVLAVLASSRGKPAGGRSEAAAPTGEDPRLQTLRTVEVTARLEEIPEGAIGRAAM